MLKNTAMEARRDEVVAVTVLNFIHYKHTRHEAHSKALKESYFYSSVG